MIILKEGDKSKGPCYKCKKLVNTTFKYAIYKLDALKIPDILQGFCDNCGSPVSIPHQSSYRIREFRERVNNQLELRVPAHYRDILIAIGTTHKISQKPNLLCRLISELYISKFDDPKRRKIKEKIFSALDEDLAKGKSNTRLSFLFSDTTYSTLQTFSKKENIDTAKIIKGIIVAAKHAILDNDDKSLSKEFDELAALRL